MKHTLALFKAYLEVGDVESATELYEDEIKDPTIFDEINIGRCSMACYLMLAQSGEEGVKKALNIYYNQGFSGNGPAAREARATIAGLIINVLCRIKGNLKKAAKIFDSQKFQEETENFLHLRARAALSLAETYVIKGQIQKARELYETGIFGVSALDDLPLRLMIMGSLVKDSCNDGNLDFARKLFEEIPITLPFSFKKMAIYRVMASINLNQAYLKAENKEGIEFMRKCFINFNKNELKLLYDFGKKGLIKLNKIFDAEDKGL
jgi:tetratricopeptide (TPR) repeat protein